MPGEEKRFNSELASELAMYKGWAIEEEKDTPAGIAPERDSGEEAADDARSLGGMSAGEAPTREEFEMNFTVMT